MWKPWIERLTDGFSPEEHIWRLHLLDWPLRLYVHRIKRPDSERELHNHPRPFIAMVLWGRYDEMVKNHPLETGHTRTHQSFSFSMFNLMPTTRFHRITYVQRNTTTLLIGRYRKDPADWGFLMLDGSSVIPWQDWVGNR